MTQRLRWRHSASLVALLALLMAMIAPAAAFAQAEETADDTAAEESADPAEGGSTEKEAPAEEEAGLAESDTSDSSDVGDSAAASDASSVESDTSDTARASAAKSTDKDKDKDKAGKHCPDHNATTVEKFEGAGTYTVNDVSFTVAGDTVTVNGGDAELCVKASTDNSGKITLADGGSYAVDFLNGGDQTPAISYLAVYSATPTTVADSILDVDFTVDDSVCEEITYVIDASDSTNLDEVTVTGTIYLGETVYHQQTITLDGSNDFTEIIVGAPGVGDYTLVWEATAGDQTVTGELDFTVKDCTTEGDTGGEEVLDVTLTVDDDVCEEITYVIDATDSDNVDAITVTGTLYLGGTFYHEETITLDGSNDFTETIVGEPGVGDYTLVWEATAGDQTVTGELDFTVQDCDTTGGDSTDAVDKVEICHATAAPTNPYRMIEPAVEGVLHGHADQHTGPVFEDGMENGEWGDIIPAFSYVDDNGDVQQFEGQNWDALGQSVYDDGCAVGDLEAANPAISIDKSADVDTVTFTGDDDTVEVTYTYEITNTGNITLDLTELSDDKIADLDVSDLDDTTLDADESTAATQIVDLDVDDFDENGEHTNVVIVTGVIEGGDVTDTDDTVTGTDDETVTVDDGSEDDGGNGTPVVVQPDIEDGGPLRICVGTDAVLTLEAMFDDLDDSEDFDFTELELALDAGDLDLADYGLDADELVFDADGNVNVTLTDLPLGTHVIAYTVTLDGETVQSDDIEVRVTVCPPFPEIPVDGDEDGEDDGGTPVVDVPMIAVDYDVVCPEGVPGFTVNVTGTDLDTNDAEILVAYDAESAPYWSGDITLGDELALRWPVDADGLELDTFVFWVSVDGVTSDLVMVDNTDLECVLGEVIDQPDVDGNDEDAPVGGDDVIDDDEAVREDDEVVTNDDEDEVMGVVLDADEAGDADDAAAGSWLPRTGTSVLALLAAGLFSLLTGAGLLRRRS